MLEVQDPADAEDVLIMLQHAHLDTVRVVGVNVVTAADVLTHLGLPEVMDASISAGHAAVIAAVNSAFGCAFSDQQFDHAWAVALAVAGAAGPWSVPAIFTMLPRSPGAHAGTHPPEHAEVDESADDCRTKRRPAGPAHAPDLLTVDEVCERLSLSERKLRQLVADRRIAVIRIGRSLRFDKRAVEEFLQATRVPALRAVEPVPAAPPDSDHLDELVRKHGLD